MSLLKKVVLFYKKEGFLRTWRRIIQKCTERIKQFPNYMRELVFCKRYLQQIQQKINGKQLFVMIPCIDWNIPLFQRPHQMALEFAKLKNSHVLFVSDEYKYDNFAGIQSVNANLTLVSCRIVPQMENCFSQAQSVTVIMCWPRQAHLLKSIPYDEFVYEYIDDLSLFYYYDEAMIARHYDLIRQADLTVCTANTLYQDALPLAHKILLSPNAGDYDFFHSTRNCAPRKELIQKTENFKCVFGYYGCLAQWFDYDLVISVAKKRPDWCFVLVGYSFDHTSLKLERESLPNVFLYPAQPYQKLPEFAAAFDIQLIPFLTNDITRATSPVKVFEYMAMGKPILTSHMPELEQYRSVVKYDDAKDFIIKAEKLLALPATDAYFDIMEQEALQNTWSNRINIILKELQTNTNNNSEC